MRFWKSKGSPQFSAKFTPKTKSIEAFTHKQSPHPNRNHYVLSSLSHSKHTPHSLWFSQGKTTHPKSFKKSVQKQKKRKRLLRKSCTGPHMSLLRGSQALPQYTLLWSQWWDYATRRPVYPSTPHTLHCCGWILDFIRWVSLTSGAVTMDDNRLPTPYLLQNTWKMSLYTERGKGGREGERSCYCNINWTNANLQIVIQVM